MALSGSQHHFASGERRRTGYGGLVIAAAAVLLCGSLAAQVVMDRIPSSRSLPEEYPESWLFVHDLNYFAQVLGKYVIVDVAAASNHHKGQFHGALLSAFAESESRGELYVAETFLSRISRGERTDAITVYEKTNLEPIAEIVLPGGKRALMVPNKGLLRLTRDDRFALVFNFTPAASVTVVDLDLRRVVAEVAVPGCSLIYPSGRRGFSTLCANGRLASYTLDVNGAVAGKSFGQPFNDIENDALYMEPATIDGISYFPTAAGRIQPIDMTPDRPAVLPPWSLIGEVERAESWLTAEGQTVAGDRAGRLYARMHRVEADGSHVPDSSEVWVFDVEARQRLFRIGLENDGSAIAVTRGEAPKLVLATGTGFDVYNTLTGAFERNVGGWPPGVANHYLLHPSR